MEVRAFRLASWPRFGAVFLFAACGAGVNFNGKPRPPRVAADALGAETAGLSRLGSVSANCHPVTLGTKDEETWSDVVCSPDLCERAVRERAADVGATALGPLEWDVDSDEVACEAAAFGEEGKAASPAKLETRASSPTSDPNGEGAADAPAKGRVDKAWHVALSYAALSPQPKASPRAAENVAFLVTAPVGRAPVGVLRASCDTRDCSYSDLRRALRAGAGRLGATWMSSVSCQEYSERLRCVADLGSGLL